MKVIVGLGNPERKYEKTRHNIGFRVIDALAEQLGVTFRNKHRALVGECRWHQEKILLVKPQTYMNLSGLAVQELCAFHQLEEEDLFVVYDDVDLDLGMLRIRPSGGPGTHNGMRSIQQSLGRNQFPRLRLGVGKPRFGDLADYVLSPFPKEEEAVVEEVVKKAVCAVETFVQKGVQEAMNQYNG